MTRFLLLIALYLWVKPLIFAQDIPPNAVAGKCYAKCYLPHEYETTREAVLVREAYTTEKVTPAVYDTIIETIMIKDSYRTFEVVPAVYDTITTKIMVQPPTSKFIVEPATYKTITENILIKPASKKWKKVLRKYNDCMGRNLEDCGVWCLVDLPAEYQTVQTQILVTPSTKKEVPIEAKYKTIKKIALKKAAKTQKKTIEPEYRNLEKFVLKKKEYVEKINVPAVYDTIAVTKLMHQGGFSDWVEVACNDNTPIKKIQALLLEQGYDPGPINNILTTQTRGALLAFQKDNNLVQGSISIATLEALGVGK